MSRQNPMPVALLLAIMATPCAAGTCKVASGAHVLPLVELYTAEGCNQCPPADRWFSELSLKTTPARTAMLAFHVDYWDDAGWPDRFADHAYSQRQDLRVTLAKKRVTYTPQVMIGRDVRVSWKDEARVQALLERERARQAQVGLSLDVSRTGDVLRIDVEASRTADAGAEPVMVWLALYQDGLRSRIDAGENRGLVLDHDRVVRALAGPWRMDAAHLSDEVEIKWPSLSDSARMGLVLFAESGSTGEGMQALAMPLDACPTRD